MHFVEVAKSLKIVARNYLNRGGLWTGLVLENL